MARPWRPLLGSRLKEQESGGLGCRLLTSAIEQIVVRAISERDGSALDNEQPLSNGEMKRGADIVDLCDCRGSE